MLIDSLASERPDDFNLGLGTTKALYRPHDMAYPHLMVLDQLQSELDRLPQDKDLVFYCRSGMRSRVASEMCVDNGFDPGNIYNLMGQEVGRLVSERLMPGTYRYRWNASGFASGVYVYRLQAGSYFETRKIILMK